MLILFDHGAPQGVARGLRDHTVITAQARGWDRLTNGALLAAAEEAAVALCPRRFDRDNEMVSRAIAS